MGATVADIRVSANQSIAAGQIVIVLEAMKMLHELRTEFPVRVLSVNVDVGDLVSAEELLLVLDAGASASRGSDSPSAPLPARNEEPAARPILEEFRQRLAYTEDAQRPEAVARRHAQGMRTARENIADLCDAGSFVEYGALAIAAQRRRRSVDDLVRNTPADGMVTGIGSVNGKEFGLERSRSVVMAYDATVLAGTQGMNNHQKTDRLLGIALEQRLPVVLFAEGGGGRPGDVDAPVVAGLHLATFANYARLSGKVPLIGIAAGRCFAGNAALLGCSDVIIATRRSNIGMGGPAMIEGGGLGTYAPEQIGPGHVQAANGVIDILVDDEAEAVSVAKSYLGYFQGRLESWNAADQTQLRDVLPAGRNVSYRINDVLRLLFDAGSVLELRAGFGVGIVTALARLEGRPVGVLANNPMHLGGAIDAPAADKAARFISLCDSHGLPLVSLIDTPGFMVGPAIEEQAQVRHVSRLFLHAAHLRVPFLAVVLRKGYGLGAMAMAGGGFHMPAATVAWPSGEFGAMGIEGAVKLGFSKELAAVADSDSRDKLFRELVSQVAERGQAINMASALEIDAVIDPAETRGWLSRVLASTKIREQGSRPVDSW